MPPVAHFGGLLEIHVAMSSNLAGVYPKEVSYVETGKFRIFRTFL